MGGGLFLFVAVSISVCLMVSAPSVLTMEAGISLESSVNMYQTALPHIAKYREDGGVDG